MVKGGRGTGTDGIITADNNAAQHVVMIFSCSSQAFSPNDSAKNAEIARILRGIATKIKRYGCTGFPEIIHDNDGNVIGSWILKF